MIKKVTVLSVVALSVMSCGSSYTDEQAKAATEFCECMDFATLTSSDDYKNLSDEDKKFEIDIKTLECNDARDMNYKPEVFADEGYGLALSEKCPDAVTAE